MRNVIQTFINPQKLQRRAYIHFKNYEALGPYCMHAAPKLLAYACLERWNYGIAVYMQHLIRLLTTVYTYSAPVWL
jgi:hypothetical protein